MIKPENILGKRGHREPFGLSPAGFLWIILLSIFSGELLIMFLLEYALPPLPPLVQNLIDALVLVAITAPTLYFFHYKPMLRSSEERDYLFKAIEQATETVVITDIKGNITYVNPMFEQVTGYTRQEVLGKNPRLMKSGRHDAGFYKKLWATIAGGSAWEGVFINRKKDGTLWEERANISPVKDSRGKITGYVSIQRDVTEEKMMEQMKDYFASITSHEMRTPLTRLALVKMLLKNIGSKDQPYEPAKIGIIIEKLGHSMNDLERVVSAAEMFTDLNLDRPRRYFHHVSLRMIIQHSLETAITTIENEKRDIKLRMDIDALPANTAILCDHEMVYRALDEILSNAVKYTQDGRKVRITGKRANGSATIKIRDDGIGIPLEKRELIFKPFYSLENPDHHQTSRYKYMGGGLGMGLTLARMIIEYHDGGLELESEGKNRGTTVTIRFPVAQTDSPSEV